MFSLVAATALACLSFSTHGQNVKTAWLACHAQVDAAIPIKMTRDEEAVVFASVFANRWAPYGGDYKTLQKTELLNAPDIACDAYAALTYYFARQLDPTVRMALVGWDHGPVGNHAQVFVGRLTVDPTIGAVAGDSYSQVASGEPAAWFVSFRVRPDLDYFSDMVETALLGGLYKSSNQIYYASTPAGMPGPPKP